MSKRYALARQYTAKYKSMLKPCRYCGNTDIYILSDRTIYNPKNVWSVTCGTDHCDSVTADTVKEAIDKWNSKR